MPENVYTLKIEDSSKAYLQEYSFFLLKEEIVKNDGIIDIIVKSDQPEYDLFNSDNTLRKPVFEIHFKNRYTKWRYLGEQFSNKPTTDPNPLTKYGSIQVSVKDSSNRIIDELPGPSISMIKPEPDVTLTKNYNLISEIYVH
jgi:hypothetical protein